MSRIGTSSGSSPSSFRKAAVWACVGAVAAFFGFIHAGQITPAGGRYDIGWATGWRWSVGYLLCAGFLLLMHYWSRSDAPEEAAGR